MTCWGWPLFGRDQLYPSWILSHCDHPLAINNYLQLHHFTDNQSTLLIEMPSRAPSPALAGFAPFGFLPPFLAWVVFFSAWPLAGATRASVARCGPSWWLSARQPCQPVRPGAWRFRIGCRHGEFSLITLVGTGSKRIMTRKGDGMAMLQPQMAPVDI